MTRELNSLNISSGLAKLVPQLGRNPEFHSGGGNRSKLRRKEGLWIVSIELHPTPKCSISVDSTLEIPLRQAKKRWKVRKIQALRLNAD
jgi:hypothetical protein